MKSKIIISLLSLLFFVSCHRSPDAKFYILNPLTSKAAKISNFHESVAIDEITLPAYCEKPQLVIYNQTNQVMLAEYHRWAESLDKNVSRIIKANLGLLLPKAIIETNAWDPFFKPAKHLKINISEFTMETLGNTNLSAQIFVLYNNQLIKKQTVNYHSHLADNSYKALVASMNQHLEQLCRDTAEVIAHS